MNEPKVPMYRNAMIQVWRLRTTCSCSRGADCAVPRLSMKKYAATVATIARPAYTQAARSRLIPLSDALTMPNIPAPPTMTGRKNWISATPKLPPAALRPSAAPFFAAG